MKRIFIYFSQIFMLFSLMLLAACNNGQKASTDAVTKDSAADTKTVDVATTTSQTDQAVTSQTTEVTEAVDPNQPKPDYAAKVDAKTEFDGPFKLNRINFESKDNVITFKAQLVCTADYEQNYVMSTHFVQDGRVIGGFQDINLVNGDGQPYKQGETVNIKRVVQVAQPFDRTKTPGVGLTIINADEKRQLTVKSSNLSTTTGYVGVIWEFPG